MKFKITRAKENNFESGLRGFFAYKNLGIEDATAGNFGANVIKAIEGKHANGEWHYHKLNYHQPSCYLFLILFELGDFICNNFVLCLIGRLKKTQRQRVNKSRERNRRAP